MTKMVFDKAIQLLIKSVSDVSGDELRVAESLVSALRSELQLIEGSESIDSSRTSRSYKKTIDKADPAAMTDFTIH